jgi:hypothetical protein
MPKLNKLLILLITLIVLSCSSDDDKSNSNIQDDIIGTWSLVSIENQGNDIPVFGCGTEHTITYNSGNLGEEYFSQDFNENPCIFNTLNFTWERTGNLINKAIEFEGNNVNEIILLTDNQLQIAVVEWNGVAVPENEQEIYKYVK